MIVQYYEKSHKTDQTFLDNFRMHETNYLHRMCLYLIPNQYNNENIKVITHVNHQRTVMASKIFLVNQLVNHKV